MNILQLYTCCVSGVGTVGTSTCDRCWRACILRNMNINYEKQVKRIADYQQRCCAAWCMHCPKHMYNRRQDARPHAGSLYCSYRLTKHQTVCTACTTCTARTVQIRRATERGGCAGGGAAAGQFVPPAPRTPSCTAVTPHTLPAGTVCSLRYPGCLPLYCSMLWPLSGLNRFVLYTDGLIER